MTGLMRHRLDDDFPEFIQNLAQLLFPHMLRPLPCMTIMRYQPRAALEGPVTIPAGTEFASVPVDDLRARSEEHTSELQSLMRISNAVFGLNKKNKSDNRQK